MNRKLILSLFILIATIIFISCSKEYSLETGSSTQARGSLHNNTGTCYTSSVIGTYTAGMAVAATNFIELQVNVTSVGSYKITSDTANGFSFENSGIFTSTGLQTIQLQASGKPILARVTNFFVSFDTTSCLLSVNVQNSTGPGGSVDLSDTAWTFTEGPRRFRGYIDTAYTFDTTVVGQKFKVMQIQGSTAARRDSVFLLSIVFPGGVVSPGSYPTTTTADFRFLGSYNINDSVYAASFQIRGVNTVVNVSSYDANTRIIKGNLAGTAKNKTNATVNITQGRFEAKLN